MSEGVERHGFGDGDMGGPCPICRGSPLDPHFIEMVEREAALPGQVMTADEFLVWLDGQAASSR